MERTTTYHRPPAPSSDAPRAGASGEGHRWARFAAGVVVILLFAFVAIPALQRVGPVREVREAIERADIDATALFYTESDVSSEAEAAIRNAMRYSAHRADCPAASPRDGIDQSATQ